MKPRPYKCEGCDLPTDAEKDPDSNCITKQGCEEAVAAVKAQKMCELWKLTFPLLWHSRSQRALAPAGPHLSLPCRGSGRRRSRPSRVLRRPQLCQSHAFVLLNISLG